MKNGSQWNLFVLTHAAYTQTIKIPIIIVGFVYVITIIMAGIKLAKGHCPTEQNVGCLVPGKTVRVRKLFFLCTAIVSCWVIVEYWPVTVNITASTPNLEFSIRMPLKDKKRLDYLFRDLCFLNGWAYTLMGSKPMSTDQYRKPWCIARHMLFHPELKEILKDAFWPPDFREICYLFNPEQLKKKLGWDTLNKYIGYFPDSRFTIFTYDSDNETVCLVLVDKTKLINVIKQHLTDFREVLQVQGITPEELSNNEKLYPFLKNLRSDGLIGTLFGFGRNNAWLYQKYRSLDLKESPMISMWQGEDDAWLEQINQKDLSFQPWNPSDLFYPPCACDLQTEETNQIKQSYREEREKIIKYYEGKDIVEATLSLFSLSIDTQSENLYHPK